MYIAGLQKLSLLDFPDKLAATVFTAGCDFRCPFCHNAGLVIDEENNEQISEDEFFEFLASRKNRLDGVCVTGGEPLLQPDIEDFLKRIHDMGFLVKLDTNGSFPERLERIINSSLADFVAMDIKNCKEKYALTAGLREINMNNIEKSVELLKEGRVEYEFRTTVVKELHTCGDFEKIGQWLSGADKYFLQHFVDSGNLIESGLHAWEKPEMLDFQRIAAKYVKNVSIRGV